MFGAEFDGDPLQPIGMGLQFSRFEAAEQDSSGGLRHAAFDDVGVHESVPSVGRLGAERLPRHTRNERAENANGIDQRVLADRRVGIDACHLDDRQVGRKRLRIDLARAVAVKRVRTNGPELFDVQLVHAVADFLVAGKADPDRAAFNFGMRNQVCGGGHDDRDTGLVVGPQQGRAVRRHHRSAAQVLQFRVVRNTNDLRGVARKCNVPAGVAFVHHGFHVRAACFR